MTELHSGTCLCGKVCFEITGAFDGFFLCHCGRCRKNTGSAHGANLFSASAKLSWLSGESLVRNYHLAGTRHQKSFCEECGSALPGLHAGGSLLVVPAGSLDTPVTVEPTGHIFCASRAEWTDALDRAPRYDGFPSAD